MKRVIPVLVFALSAVTFLLVAPCLAKDVDPRIAKIDHWIVICQEGWSFDGLYGSFPNAEGLASAGPAAAQVDRSGRPLATLPELSTDPNVAPGLPARPFDLAPYVEITVRTTGLVPRFYAQQLQIDNGLVEPGLGSQCWERVAARWTSSSPGATIPHWS